MTNIRDRLPEIIREAIETGEQVVSDAPVTVTDVMIGHCAQGFRDFQPIHVDTMAAHAQGFKNVIAHGVLTLGLMPALFPVFTTLPECGLALRVLEDDKVRYRKEVVAGDEVWGWVHFTNSRDVPEGLWVRMEFEMRVGHEIVIEGKRLLLFTG